MKTHGSSHKFFRVYIPNVTPKNDMNLPIVSDKISGMPLPRKVTVKCVSSGNIWRMDMKASNESDTVFLRDGWKKIVKDENLTEPVFLVFEFDGSREFHFCVFEDGSMCKRMRSPLEKEVIEVENEEESEETDEDGDDEDDDDDGNGNDDDDYDDDDESTKGLEESPRTKERGGTSRRRAHLKTDSHKFDEYLDNELNPSFLVDMTAERTLIPAFLIKDYNLTFPKYVSVRDKIGTLKRKIVVWKNRSVFLNGIGSITRRNRVKRGDTMVCELKVVDGGLVQEIKVHIIKG